MYFVGFTVQKKRENSLGGLRLYSLESRPSFQFVNERVTIVWERPPGRLWLCPIYPSPDGKMSCQNLWGFIVFFFFLFFVFLTLSLLCKVIFGHFFPFIFMDSNFPAAFFVPNNSYFFFHSFYLFYTHYNRYSVSVRLTVIQSGIQDW